MNHFIRELDEAIGEVATSLGRDEAAKHLATTSIARQNNEIEVLAERIELAVKEGKDEAASAGIAKQLDLEDTIAALHRSLDDATERRRSTRRHCSVCARSAAKWNPRCRPSSRRRHALAGSSTGTAGTAGIARPASSRDKADKAEAGFNRPMARATGCRRHRGVHERRRSHAVEGARNHAAESSHCRAAGARQGVHRRRRQKELTVGELVSPANAPFLVAICLMVAIGALEGLSLLIGGGLSHHRSVFGATHRWWRTPGRCGILGWLHIGRAPILVLIIIFSAGLRDRRTGAAMGDRRPHRAAAVAAAWSRSLLAAGALCRCAR